MHGLLDLVVVATLVRAVLAEHVKLVRRLDTRLLCPLRYLSQLEPQSGGAEAHSESEIWSPIFIRHLISCRRCPGSYINS